MIYAANVPEDDLADKGANNKHVQVSGSSTVCRRADGQSSLLADYFTC
jgi:hypothetical protein